MVVGEAVVDKEPNLDDPLNDNLDTDPDPHWWTDSKELESWFGEHAPADIVTDGSLPVVSAPESEVQQTRLECIKESHALLKQFSPRELKILMTLKRNTSHKAWTLREDLMVLTLSVSNREIAEVLKDRNKEAVKKRLQLLKSKGLSKRQPEAEPVEP